MKSLTARVNLLIVVERSLMSHTIRRVVLSISMVALVVANVPLMAAGAGQAPIGAVSGSAQNASGQVMRNVTVQLRSVGTGKLAGTTTSGADGAFGFTALNPGTFVVEVVNAGGTVIGTSAAISLTARSVVASGVTLSTAGATAAAVAGGGIFTSTASIVVSAAAGKGVAGVAVAANRPDPSPSR